MFKRAKFKESDNRNLEAFKIDHRKYKNTSNEFHMQIRQNQTKATITP